ncbi:MAG: hypothetical protein JF609_10340 [Verrucomicrobia bacterium]|nr:hypothetical protein [Verrucomicrobiota bacterium]
MPGVIVVLTLLLSVGCSKHAGDAPSGEVKPTFDGVQFCNDFASATPEIKSLSNKAWMSIQSGAFTNALKQLGQLDANVALNAAQKKSLADLTEQVKRKMAADAAAR